MEAGNLAAAVEWYLAHDRAPLPHLFRVLWMYWGLRDHRPGRAVLDDRGRPYRRPGGDGHGPPRRRPRPPVRGGALAERFDHAGLSAWSQVQLGILAKVRGRLEDTRALLDEGLELSLATRGTRNVTLCLTAFAQLAFVEGDGERAAGSIAGR
jgi:hypothetical protein